VVLVTTQLVQAKMVAQAVVWEGEEPELLVQVLLVKAMMED
jgi:hypothetical protein